MSNSQRYWTDEEEEILKELWNSPEVTVHEIAKVFGRTRGAIRAKACRLNLDGKAVPELLDRDYLEILRKQLEVEDG